MPIWRMLAPRAPPFSHAIRLAAAVPRHELSDASHTRPRAVGMGADVGACAGGDSGDASVAADLDVDALVAAATDPDLATQAERLRKWMGSGTSMLDLRAEKDFERRRFAGAVNIPFGDLDGRLHELPPRGTPLAVLLKQPDGPDDAATFEAQLRVFAADFKSRPWRVESVFVSDPGSSRSRDSRDSLFLGIAQSAGVDVVSGAVPRNERGRLWEPSDAVARWLPRIERRRTDDSTFRRAGDLVRRAQTPAPRLCAGGTSWRSIRAKGPARCAALARRTGSPTQCVVSASTCA